MCSARWVQCEKMTNRMGFLSKHPTTGKPIPSPFINIGINYMNQAVRLWNEIFQIVKENCSTEYGESTPQDDLMERCSVQERGNTMFEKVNPFHPDAEWGWSDENNDRDAACPHHEAGSLC